MHKIDTYGQVTDDGILKISYRQKFDEAIRAGMSGKRVKVTVETLGKRRSSQKVHEDGTITGGQNSYYWGVIVQEYRNGAWEMQQRYIGSDQAHDELKINCNFSEIINESTGEVMRLPGSTAQLTTMQFEDYLTRCRAFILDWFNIDCPLPGVQTEIAFNTK